MMPKPPTPPPPIPQVDLGHIVRTIEIIGSTIQQQNATMIHQHQKAIQEMQAAIQELQAARTATASSQPQEHFGLTDFMRLGPPKFSGDSSPDQADQWIRELEKIFEATSCPEDKKIVFATYLLSGESEFWWQRIKQMMEDRDEAIDWENFRYRFLEKYFPDSAKYAKEVEFLQLEQGSMSVQEYVTRFEHLARFYTKATSEVWRCRKFEEGLKYELKRTVIPMSIREFPALVEKATIVEGLEGSAERVTIGIERVIRSSSRGSSSGKSKVDQRKPYARSQPEKGDASSRSFSARVQCFRCRGPHHIDQCDRAPATRRCFVCQRIGHLAKECRDRFRAAPSWSYQQS